MPTELIERLTAERAARKLSANVLVAPYCRKTTYEGYRVRVPDMRRWVRRTRIALHSVIVAAAVYALGETGWLTATGACSVFNAAMTLLGWCGVSAALRWLVERWTGPFVYDPDDLDLCDSWFIHRCKPLLDAPKDIATGAFTLDDLRAALEALDRKVERDLLAVEPRAIEILLEDGRDQ